MAVEPLPLAGRIDITEDDIVRLRAEGWDYIPTNMPETYRPYWTLWHAIREFVQNALDETEDFDMRLTSEGLVISDQGEGFLAADLLLHYREKPRWARGQFGEGLKIACVVCLRSGYPVYIWTKGKVIRPLFLRKRFIERGEIHEARVIYFFWKEFPRERGTTVLIQGYTGELYLDRFVQRLPQESFIFNLPGEIEGHRYTDSIIDYPVGTAGPRTHRLYVRDIYVTDFWAPTLYSYNLWRVKLDPDRVGVQNPMEVVDRIGTLWAYCTNKEAIQLWMKNAVKPKPEIEFLEMKESFWINYKNKDLWREVWRELFGDAILRTDEELARRARHLGFTVIEAPGPVVDTLRGIVKTDKEAIEDYEKKLRVPISPDELTRTQQKHLALAYWLVEKLLYLYALDRRTIKKPQITAFKIFPTPGAYMTDEIIIRQDTLDSESKTVEVLIHELAHHTCDGCEDLTDRHVSEMEYLAWLLYILRERPTGWDLYEAMEKHGITPKFKPRGKRPERKPVYPIKQGDIVKIVSGLFAGQWGRVLKVWIDDQGRYMAMIYRRDSPSPISVPIEHLEPFPEKVALFSVGDVVKIIPTGEEGEIKDRFFSDGKVEYEVMINRPPFPRRMVSETNLVYLRSGPLIKETPHKILEGITREGVVRGIFRRFRERIREYP